MTRFTRPPPASRLFSCHEPARRRRVFDATATRANFLYDSFSENTIGGKQI